VDSWRSPPLKDSDGESIPYRAGSPASRSLGDEFVSAQEFGKEASRFVSWSVVGGEWSAPIFSDQVIRSYSNVRRLAGQLVCMGVKPMKAKKNAATK